MKHASCNNITLPAFQAICSTSKSIMESPSVTALKKKTEPRMVSIHTQDLCIINFKEIKEAKGSVRSHSKQKTENTF